MPIAAIPPFTAIQASLKSHKSGLSIGVLDLTLLLTEYCSLDISFTLIHFFVASFATVELVSLGNIHLLF